MKCEMCGKKHKEGHEHYRLVQDLKDVGYPVHDPRYPYAHEQASKKEKEAYGEKSYNRLKKMDMKAKKHELIGKNTKSGKIEVSKKVPPSLRSEVSFHEKEESKILRKKKS